MCIRDRTGTSSDLSGNFSLNLKQPLPANATLTVSYIGYKTQTVTPGAKTFLEITLEEESALLAVSYTHLDVYKRQVGFRPRNRIIVIGFVRKRMIHLADADRLVAVRRKQLRQRHDIGIVASENSVECPHPGICLLYTSM